MRRTPRQTRPLTRLIAFVLLGAALACGQDLATEPGTADRDATVVAASSAVAASGAAGQAQNFTAQLRPLNPDVGYHPVHGAATLKVKDGVLTVRVNASGLQPGMVHAQHIHMNSSCPGEGADGGDGIVNIVDGLPFYGGVLTGLDGDLTDPAMGPGFPNPQNAGGAITYRAQASVAALEALIGGPLDLANRAVVLHGVAADTDLSADPVAAANPAVLPIACGTVDPNDGKS